MFSPEVKALFIAERDKFFRQLIGLSSLAALILTLVTLLWLGEKLMTAMKPKPPLKEIEEWHDWRKRVNEEFTWLEGKQSRLEHRVNMDQKARGFDLSTNYNQ